jgi:hypothetical protein
MTPRFARRRLGDIAEDVLVDAYVSAQSNRSVQHDANGPRGASQVISRWQWMLFVVAGAILILAGGFAAAIDGVTPSPHLSWASAYLVLVCGSAQIALGGGQALINSTRSRPHLVPYQFATFNLANASVLAGTLSGLSVVLDAGSALFLVALGLFAWGTKGADSHHTVTFFYRTALFVLGVSVPIGVLLAR